MVSGIFLFCLLTDLYLLCCCLSSPSLFFLEFSLLDVSRNRARPRVDTHFLPQSLNLVWVLESRDSPLPLDFLATKKKVSLNYHFVVFCGCTDTVFAITSMTLLSCGLDCFICTPITFATTSWIMDILYDHIEENLVNLYSFILKKSITYT